MFLAETWLDKARLIYIRDKLKFEGLLEFSREGRGGGGGCYVEKICRFFS